MSTTLSTVTGSAGPLIWRTRLLGPNELAIEEPSDDVRPGPAADEVIVRPDAVGICATDLELLDGTLIYLRTGRTRLPLTLGHEWTGIVEAIGGAVDGVRAGQRVVGEVSIGCGICADCTAGAYHQCERRTETGVMGRDGALASHMRMPVAAIHVVPDEVDPRDAALAEPLAVAIHAIDRAGEDIDELLVVGGGTVGILAAWVAAIRGSSVVVAEADAARRRLVADLGVRCIAVEDVADGRWSTVLEASGAPAGLATAARALARRGRLVLVGLTGTSSQPLPTDRIVVEELQVIGSLGSPGTWPAAIRLIVDGMVRPSRLVGAQSWLEPGAILDGVREAFEGVRRRPPSVVKTLVRLPAPTGTQGHSS